MVTFSQEAYAGCDEDFLNLANSLGNPFLLNRNREIIETITSKTREEATHDSLSKRYGLNKFPAHTDFAYEKTPPKFILLRYVGKIEKPSPTIIVNFDFEHLSKLELNYIKHKIWYVKNSCGGFYSTILSNGILRYDKEVMKQVNPESNKMDSILDKMCINEFHWTPNKVLILNNWNTLHYRPSLSTIENKKRILQRISII